MTSFICGFFESSTNKFKYFTATLEELEGPWAWMNKDAYLVVQPTTTGIFTLERIM